MSENKEQINNTQLWTLLVCMIWPGLITYGSGIAARQAGRDFWLSGILTLLTTMVFVPLILYTGRKFNGQTLTEYSVSLLGKILGKVIGMVLVIYFLFAATVSVSIYLHHLVGYLLPETPLLVLTIMHVLVIIYMVWKGPEVIARISVIAFVTTLIFYILVFLATMTEIRFDRVTPIFETSLLDISKASIKIDSFTGQSLMVLAMLFPMLKDKKKALRSTLTGVAVGGFFYITFFITELIVMGSHLTAQMRLPSMDFVRSIQITQYLHRFESFFVALWYWSILIQTCMQTYCTTLSLRQTIGVQKNNKWIVAIIGLSLALLSYYIAYDKVWFLNFIENQWYYYFLPIQFGLPLLLVFVSLFRKTSK